MQATVVGRADDRAGLSLVDDAPQLSYLPCDGEAIESVSIWLNADEDRVVLESDDDEVVWSTDTPEFDADGRFVDDVDLPDEWWLDDTQIEM